MFLSLLDEAIVPYKSNEGNSIQGASICRAGAQSLNPDGIRAADEGLVRAIGVGVHNCTPISLSMCDAWSMPQLIVVEKIDGNPVSWRCSDCRQNFAARGKLTTKERLAKVNAEFKAHMEENHKVEEARPKAFAAAAPWPK